MFVELRTEIFSKLFPIYENKTQSSHQILREICIYNILVN